MTGYSIPWTHKKDSIRLSLCLYSLAFVTCLNLTTYRRCNNHLNAKDIVLEQENQRTKDLEQKSGLCYPIYFQWRLSWISSWRNPIWKLLGNEKDSLFFHGLKWLQPLLVLQVGSGHAAGGSCEPINLPLSSQLLEIHSCILPSVNSSS